MLDGMVISLKGLVCISVVLQDPALLLEDQAVEKEAWSGPPTPG